MRRDTSRGRLAAAMARLILMLAVIIGLTATAAAQTAHRGKTRKAAPETKSGKLRQPTQAEARALSEELQRLYDRNPDNLNAVVTESGAVMIELPEEYHDVSIVTLNPDGTMAMECVNGMKAANERINGKRGKRGRRAQAAHRHAPPSRSPQTPVWEEK